MPNWDFEFEKPVIHYEILDFDPYGDAIRVISILRITPGLTELQDNATGLLAFQD